MPYFPNLAGEIARRGIKKKAIADALNICNRSLNNKLSGRVPFTWDEVKLIRSQFFPDMSPDDLFMTNASYGMAGVISHVSAVRVVQRQERHVVSRIVLVR